MMRWILPPLALAGMVFAAWSSATRGGAAPVDAAIAPPAAPAFARRIAAIGLVEPQGEAIHVSSPISERVATVSARVGQRVAAGDELARLDDREAAAAVAAAEARVAVESARVAELAASPRAEDLPPAEARIARARVALAEADDRAARAEEALKRAALSADDAAVRRFARAGAAADLASAEADLARLRVGASAEQLATAEAGVAAARAEAAALRQRLDRHVVRAPLDATVLAVEAHPGEQAAPGTTVAVIGDCTRLLVRAEIDERDAHRLRDGAAAVAIPRGRREARVALVFVRSEPLVRPKRVLAGDGDERVDTRVLEALFALPDDAGLRVGQQVDVDIEAEQP
ncbi:MAG TPA: HlyD family efflux transporter periplasmic adaptor subunit [Planctomycetota bacterium]|nr:HlyD family efflux transporter periplasmic adaptor subunit [Planctomycetota bacterium]